MFNESAYPYELPEKEGIYEILIGDTECGPYWYKDDGSYVRMAMPR
ncbi:MAG: hypothetical protein LUD72_11025 [Bacteroidales bacterium]|nr:hypothetical protein [Bacteroidales bacterium]